MKHGKLIKIKAKVGTMSLIGCMGKLPIDWGNYFWFDSGPRCVNMWAENLDEAQNRFLTDGLVEGYLFTESCRGSVREWFVVKDDRIPVDWLYNTFCWTGGQIPSNIEILREMFSVHGDPGDEIEQFIDPSSYHEKRGADYIEYNGGAIIKQKVVAQPHQLRVNWTVKTTGDVGYICAPYIPQPNNK